MKRSKTILVVDDEQEIRSLIRVYLEKDGYSVEEAQNGREALEKFHKDIDLMVLDIMMPHMDGVEVLRRVRKESNIPIIILSAKSEDYDKILGLDLGADDFMVKPFNPLELVARVTANIRRFYQLGCEKQEDNRYIAVKNIVLDVQECVVYVGKEKVSLTSVEYKLLQLFMNQPGRVFTKQQIYEAGWGERYVVDDNSIMVCISKLRAKLNDTQGTYISTIRGLGYRFEK